MRYVMLERALAHLDISEILIPTVDLSVVLMASVRQLVHVKEANASIHAQAHVEPMLYARSITIYHLVRVHPLLQEILSIYAPKYKKVK